MSNLIYDPCRSLIYNDTSNYVIIVQLINIICRVMLNCRFYILSGTEIYSLLHQLKFEELSNLSTQSPLHSQRKYNQFDDHSFHFNEIFVIHILIDG
jgi:hypothetical protein